MGKYYILDGHTVVVCDNVLQWAMWFKKANRHIDKTIKGEVEVSTVFLGLDHSFGDGAPLLFETMIFGGEHDQYQERYATWEEAEAGHKKACAIAFIEVLN